MYIDSITLENFQSFANKTRIIFPQLTAIIGSNGTGKSAVLLALSRLFGIDKSLHTILNSDFHIPPTERLEDQPERQLSIEVTLKFPELEAGDGSESVAEMFRHMIIDEPGSTPYCRIKLEATWYNSNTPGGDVEQKIYWILSGGEEITDEQKQPLRPFERSKIQVHYIPATRDPSKQLKHSAGSIMFQLLRSIEWSEATKGDFDTFAQNMKTAFQAETGVQTMQTSFTEHWQRLFTSEMYQSINVNPVEGTFEKMLSKIEVSFTPSPTGYEESIERLSDGMKSLFYFTLICSIFDLENKILANQANGIDPEMMSPPLLSIFAIEEPENHLAPHYIGKIIKLYREIIGTGRAQVLVTSHSPSILRRIEPEEIRYLRLDNRKTMVSTITMPEAASDAFKYVKEAVKAYPELYFSKLVVLGEGDSEEIVIPKVAEAFDIPMDDSFVSMVPLGGRHVNHFWKLLNELKIPYITLLDYDRKRGGGAWGRIKYSLIQLLENGNYESETILGSMTLEQLKSLHNAQLNEANENSWVEHLKRFDVYFSFPIDLDFMMFECFPEQYKGLAPENGGPNIPEVGHEDYDNKTRQAIAAVLKKEANEIDLVDFAQSDHEKYYWYRYLFLGRGKPASHIEALSKIPDDILTAQCPAVLQEVVTKIATKLSEG